MNFKLYLQVVCWHKERKYYEALHTVHSTKNWSYNSLYSTGCVPATVCDGVTVRWLC